MLKHQKIREAMKEVRALYAAGVISTHEFVSSMNQLKANLEAEEKKLYAVDHRGHLDLLRFITGTIPNAFSCIHARFPHLTFPEVIAFEQIMRDSGGSVMTHSGKFIPTKRLVWKAIVPIGTLTSIYKFTCSWSCCHSNAIIEYIRRKKYVCIRHTCHILTRYGALGSFDDGIAEDASGENDTSPDLTNPNPIGRCDTPVGFSLEDVKAEDSRGSETLAEIKAATRVQIDGTEVEIARLRKKSRRVGRYVGRARPTNGRVANASRVSLRSRGFIF